MSKDHENAHDAIKSASNETMDADLGVAVKEVLYSERTLWRATERLAGLAAPHVDEVCLGVVPPSAGGLDVDIVSRTIVRRAHDALTAITATVDSPARVNARVHLRTMTEDLIFLKWLRSFDEEVATKFVVLSALVEACKAVDAQENFLPIAYQQLGEDAPDLCFPDATDTLARAKNSLRELCRTQGWGNRPPSIKKMAEATDLVPVYDFFYSLSSKAVHSNLHEMGRMVWGTEDTVDISSKPFENLHADLSVVYGTWLFDALLSAARDMFEPVQRLLSGEAYVVWLAVILVGPARNGQLPLMIHPEELRWRWH